MLCHSLMEGRGGKPQEAEVCVGDGRPPVGSLLQVMAFVVASLSAPDSFVVVWFSVFGHICLSSENNRTCISERCFRYNTSCIKTCG